MTSKSDRSSTSADEAVASTHREDWGRLLSLLVARTRRLDLAEDALGEAFARASDRWPGDGVPTNPAGWIYTTASRVIVATMRAEAVHGRKAPLLATSDEWVHEARLGDVDDLGDERLGVILLCSHPALSPAARSALALRLVVGTPTAEIARLFLVSVPTMAARITRAKRKIVAAGIPLAAPVDDELRARLDDVCRTIYLAFTAGYAPGQGSNLLRPELAGEAVRLATILDGLVPREPQVRALLGLLVLQHARRDARTRHGQLVTLADQDRSMWRADEIEVGSSVVAALTPSVGYAEELRLQALIAAEHASVSTSAATDWSAVAALYLRLEELTGSPVVRLNRSVAVGEAEGPAAGLRTLDGLGHMLDTNHRFHAVRADLAKRAGDHTLARTSYAAALALCGNDVERRFLLRQAKGLVEDAELT